VPFAHLINLNRADKQTDRIPINPGIHPAGSA
jgi:hypothetical protein